MDLLDGDGQEAPGHGQRDGQVLLPQQKDDREEEGPGDEGDGQLPREVGSKLEVGEDHHELGEARQHEPRQVETCWREVERVVQQKSGQPVVWLLWLWLLVVVVGFVDGVVKQLETVVGGHQPDVAEEEGQSGQREEGHGQPELAVGQSEQP